MFSIRPTTASDVPQILSFIHQIAEYEKLSDEVIGTEEELRESLFGNKRSRAAEVIFAEEDGVPVGFAVFYHTFPTFYAKPGMYLEDIFVMPSKRAHGYGKRLLARVAEIAKERGCPELEWKCLRWNTPSIEFYERVGAKEMKEWTAFRINGPAFDELAASSQRYAQPEEERHLSSVH